MRNKGTVKQLRKEFGKGKVGNAKRLWNFKSLKLFEFLLFSFYKFKYLNIIKNSVSIRKCNKNKKNINK